MTDKLITTIPVEGLEQVIYWMSAGRDDFDIFSFRNALPEKVGENDNFVILISPSDDDINYYVVFAWNVTDEDIDLSVEYRVGKMSPVVCSEGAFEGPPADRLMEWLGEFFKNKTAPSHVHIRYRYPYTSRTSTIPFSFNSPLPGNAEIYGIALRLPDKPSGATSVRLTKESSDWYAEVIADHEVNFADFSPFAQATTLQTVLRTFLEDGAK